MILVDASAWIEFLRGTGSPVDRTLTKLLQENAELATSEVVAMELLAGVPSDHARHAIRSRLLSLDFLSLDGLADFEDAASVYRACRLAGETLRGLTDCLVAVPAIRADAEILHRDRDFDAIARHTPLRIHSASGG